MTQADTQRIAADYTVKFCVDDRAVAAGAAVGALSMPVFQAAHGQELAYTVHGNGPARVLLIMGFGTSQLGWVFQTNYIQEKRADEFSVCVFDNRSVRGVRRPFGLPLWTV